MKTFLSYNRAWSITVLKERLGYSYIKCLYLYRNYFCLNITKEIVLSQAIISEIIKRLFPLQNEIWAQLQSKHFPVLSLLHQQNLKKSPLRRQSIEYLDIFNIFKKKVIFSRKKALENILSKQLNKEEISSSLKRFCWWLIPFYEKKNPTNQHPTGCLNYSLQQHLLKLKVIIKHSLQDNAEPNGKIQKYIPGFVQQRAGGNRPCFMVN